jgi:hypothetical protein
MLQVCPTLQAISPHPLLCSSEPDQHQYTPLFSHIAGHIESASNTLAIAAVQNGPFKKLQFKYTAFRNLFYPTNFTVARLEGRLTKLINFLL